MDWFLNLPKPSRDEALHKSILAEGFKRYPERESNFRKYQDSPKTEHLAYLPVMLDIENISRCNYRCHMCQVSAWKNNQRAADLQFNDFQKLVDSQYGLIEIKLQGSGEPMLGSSYFDMISHARSKSIWVRSTTNASLLHLNDNYKRLIDADICEIQISIDGASTETYEKIRQGGKFKIVSENCIKLNKYCQEVKTDRTRMWVVVQKDNFKELIKFPSVAAELGFKRLTLSLDINDYSDERWIRIKKNIDMSDNFTEEHAQLVVSEGLKHGVEVTFWTIDDKYDTSSLATLCPWPFHRAFVSSDLRVVPCCMIGNPEAIDLGDARDFTKVWNNEDMKAFRRRHLQGDIPDKCQSCYQ